MKVWGARTDLHVLGDRLLPVAGSGLAAVPSAGISAS